MTIPDLNPTAYTGVKQRTPPNTTKHKVNPTPQNIIGFDIGDIWMNTVGLSSWQLMSKSGGVAVWQPLGGGGAQISTLTGDDALPVIPAAGNINIIGSGITTTNSAPNTLQVALNVPVSIANGGTNAVAMATADGVCYYDGTRIVTTAAGVAGQTLTSNGPGVAPTYQDNGNGNVIAALALTDNAVVRGDGGATGVKTSTVVISNAGQMTNASQPAFKAYVSAPVLNVTGDGTGYTVIFDTELFDIGNSYDNSTGIFTVPVTGKYQFHFNCYFSGLTAAFTSGRLWITGTQNIASITLNPGVIREPGNALILQVSGMASLNAGDTVRCSLTVSGDTKTVSVNNGSDICHFSGYLIC